MGTTPPPTHIKRKSSQIIQDLEKKRKQLKNLRKATDMTILCQSQLYQEYVSRIKRDEKEQKSRKSLDLDCYKKTQHKIHRVNTMDDTDQATYSPTHKKLKSQLEQDLNNEEEKQEMYGKENNMTISNLREPKKKSTFHEEVNHHEYEQNRRSEKIEHFCQPSQISNTQQLLDDLLEKAQQCEYYENTLEQTFIFFQEINQLLQNGQTEQLQRFIFEEGKLRNQYLAKKFIPLIGTIIQNTRKRLLIKSLNMVDEYMENIKYKPEPIIDHKVFQNIKNISEQVQKVKFELEAKKVEVQDLRQDLQMQTQIGRQMREKSKIKESTIQRLSKNESKLQAIKSKIKKKYSTITSASYINSRAQSHKYDELDTSTHQKIEEKPNQSSEFIQ